MDKDIYLNLVSCYGSGFVLPVYGQTHLLESDFMLWIRLHVACLWTMTFIRIWKFVISIYDLIVMHLLCFFGELNSCILKCFEVQSLKKHIHSIYRVISLSCSMEHKISNSIKIAF